jgi:hypothetical protein
MKRYKVEFITTGPDDEVVFKTTPLWETLKKNGIVAGSLRIQELDDFLHAKDPRWDAILEKVDEMVASGKPLVQRGQAMVSGRSGAHLGSVHCKVVLYDDRSCTTKSLYLLEARESHNAIGVKVDGPYEDADDEYWIAMAKRDGAAGNAIITEDWVHRTASKDDPKAVAAGGGGHGGAEFRFMLLDAHDFNRLRQLGLDVEYQSIKGDHDFEHSGYMLTTHNCWYQGMIPQKHRHLFKVNAKMVKGFNPTVMV